STSEGSILLRSTSAFSVSAKRSSGRTVESLPFRLPTAVRAAPTITALFMAVSLLSGLAGQERRRLTWSPSLQKAQISPVGTCPHAAHSFSTVGSTCSKTPRAFSRKPKRKLCFAPGEASPSRAGVGLGGVG